MMECNHYVEMWFLWLGHVMITTQNNHVVVSGLKLKSFWWP